MTDVQALILGLVQGITEFLPVSSSGHLILVPWLFEWTGTHDDEQFKRTFDVATNVGTLFAVAIYFWRDLVGLLRAWLRSLATRRIDGHDQKVAWLVIAASVPAALIGALGEKLLESNFGQPWQIAIFLIAFGGLLWLADRQPEDHTLDDLGLRHAVGVGLAQTLALMPGVSRSGITMTAGRFLGLDRDTSARFSFLIYSPIVLGAVLWKGLGLLRDPLPGGWERPFLIGIVAAAIAGLVAIWGLLAFLRSRTYTPFAVYRLIAGSGVLLLILAGVRPADYF